MTHLKKVLNAEPEAVALGPLLSRLRELIVQARTQALRAVDAIQVQTCWEIGRYIVEFEQQGQARARYGARLLPQLAERLMQEFSRGFDARNLRHMRTFYQAFPMWDALRHELSWTHYRRLLRVDSEAARQWYVSEAIRQNWSSRALERQIGTLYDERLLASQDKAAVAAEASTLHGHHRQLQCLTSSSRFSREFHIVERLTSICAKSTTRRRLGNESLRKVLRSSKASEEKSTEVSLSFSGRV
jgi:hypothetical protein